MSWWTDAVNAVADAIEEGANAAGEAVSDAVETVGNAIEEAIDSTVGDVPVMGDALGWVGGIVSDALDLFGASFKGGMGILGGPIGGALRIVGGIASGHRGLIHEGLGDIFSPIAGAIILIGGKAITLIQSTILLEARERKLTKQETQFLTRVFRKSIAYYNVRLVEGRAGIYGLNPRPFTLGNTIYLKKRNVSQEPELLVHECVHVWQYQNLGARYTSDALYAQRFVADAYSWEKEISRGNDRWVEFNEEAQASFIQDIYTKGELLTGNSVAGPGGGVFYDADGQKSIGQFVVNVVDHTVRANDAVTVVRGPTSQRLSSLL